MSYNKCEKDGEKRGTHDFCKHYKWCYTYATVTICESANVRVIKIRTAEGSLDTEITIL